MASPLSNTRPANARPGQRRRGSAIIEFTLVGTFLFLPLLAGLASVGMSMVMSLQVSNLNSNAGQLFASGVDLSLPANVNILLRTAGNLNISASGGDGVVILSEIDGTSSGGGVCSRQLIVGNAGLRGSSYVNPAANLLDSSGDVTNLNDPTAQASPSFTAILPLAPGQIAYLAETYFNDSQYAWAFAPSGTGTGIYVKALF